MILIAEDHPDSREALQALLEAVGYHVLLAGDGREAVERARAEHPDLILMDIMMPGMDGLEATKLLRDDPDGRDVPIVALTAMEGARERAIQAGCDDFLAKPIEIPVLLQKVRGWLDVGSQRHQA